MDAALLTSVEVHQGRRAPGARRHRHDHRRQARGVRGRQDVKEARGLVYDRRDEEALGLNVTNVKSLIALFGRETNNWVGKKVTLFPSQQQSDSGFAIRVRGSPDIAKDITFTLKLARKKPRR
jgi:hypothetical protein